MKRIMVAIATLGVALMMTVLPSCTPQGCVIAVREQQPGETTTQWMNRVVDWETRHPGEWSSATFPRTWYAFPQGSPPYPVAQAVDSYDPRYNVWYVKGRGGATTADCWQQG